MVFKFGKKVRWKHENGDNVVLLVIYTDSLKSAPPLFMSTGFILNHLYILIL